MESARIERLLEKYFEATSTLKEEKELKQYFAKAKDIPAHLLEHKDLFNYYTESALEESSKPITLSRSTIALRWLSIAAAVVFTFGAFTMYQQNEAEKREARLAYAETQRALELISKNLNKGTGAIAQLDKFNKGTEAMSELQNYKAAEDKLFVLD